MVVNLYIKGRVSQQRVHRLVAQAFIPNPENKPEVNHKDGNKENNDISNLEWNTSKENTNHAIKTGLRINSGEKFHSSKMSEKEIHKICKLLEENKIKVKDIPKKIGGNCTIKIVQNILYNNSWSQISSQYDLSKHTIEENHGKSKLTKKQVTKICKLLQDTNLNYKEIALKVGGCTIHDVNHIKNKFTWKSISDNYDFSHRDKIKNL